ncbi:MAG: toxin TcdB middle/N-terminal domain-containing protein [Myxococcota bacterium]|nr:toxin TcdB middle/N-terminal domain-containing protein [Myxococcota bacterium]
MQRGERAKDPKGVAHTSPGQRPGRSGKNETQSPVGAFHGSPFQGSDSISHYLPRALPWAGMLGPFRAGLWLVLSLLLPLPTLAQTTPVVVPHTPVVVPDHETISPDDNVAPPEQSVEESDPAEEWELEEANVTEVSAEQIDDWEQTAEAAAERLTETKAEGRGLPNGFAGKSGVTPQTLALPDGSGSMQGMGESFTPNLNTGSGTFSVPIALPPGRRGLQPQIGVAYTTGSGDGPLGWGWSMGTPFISRQADKGMPLYTSGDRFMYNGGQELVPIDMPSEESWPTHVWDPASNDLTYFRARIEGGYMRFFYNRTLDTWLVQDRQGNHYFYGESSGEKIVGPKGTFQWSLSRMADVRRATGAGGNDVQYVYLTDGRNLYINDIYWNSYEFEYGVLDKYQHRLHFVYETRPDPSVSFAACFRMEQNLRLKRIEVASYQNEPGGARRLNRVYLFTYEDQTHSFHSRLSQVQVCGRDWVDGGGGTCLPPLDFTYSRITGVGPDGSASSEPIEGFGYFNEQTRDLAVSPDVSLDDENVDFMDVNQDGLPDLLVTRPDYFGGNHAAILNDGLGSLNSEEAVRIDNPSGWSMNLKNMNISLLDMDGAGNADLLHMPYGQAYHFYRLKKSSEGAFEWEATDDIPVNQHIDFTSDAMDIRLVDINNDHLIDVVRSTGNRMQHFLNLSAFPDHEGQFGRIDTNGRPVPGESIDTCVLYRGSMMQFHKGNLQFGDMNGDGLQDIVDLRSGDIAYWPNRGYGNWGDTDEECGPGEIASSVYVTMESSPVFHNPEGEGVSIADLNGDGLADILEIKFNAVAVWINRGDDSFTDRHIIAETPPTNSGFYHKVRLADINGSGTVDIVWGDAGGYKYLDLAGEYREQPGNGGLPPGLLEQVDNGLGATTYMEYAASTELMVDAKTQEDPWESTAPMPMTVIRKVTTTDNLDAIGGTRGEYTQEYLYRDPYYDGPEAEFKGFGYGEAWDRERDADGNGVMDPSLCTPQAIARGEAPIVSRNWFHQGIRPECTEPPENENWPETWGPESEACSHQQHRDNPLLGLTGASLKSDVYSPCTGKVISATVSEIDVFHLFDSNDPDDDRTVAAVVPNAGRVYKYDLSKDQGDGFDETYNAVTLTGTEYDFGAIQDTYRTAAAVGKLHRIVGTNVVNSHGYPTEAHNGGFHPYAAGYPYEYADCDGNSNYFVYAFNSATWVHTQTESWSTGPGPQNGNTGDCNGNWLAPDTRLNWLQKTYNAYGELDTSIITYWDVVPDGNGGHQVSATPSEYCTFKDFNDYGQEERSWSRCQGDCHSDSRDMCLTSSENVYAVSGDEHYSAYIRQERLRIHDTSLPVQTFTATATWDAGFAQITDLVSFDGAEGKVVYDDLGRFQEAYGPNPDTGKLCQVEPIKKVFYHYDTAPMPFMETLINTKSRICESEYDGFYNHTVGLGSFDAKLYTYVDAMGRPFATITKGDEVLNQVEGESAAYPWVISGYTERNAKGAAIRSCEPVPIDGPVFGNVSALFGLQSKTLNCAYQEFDAHGQPIMAYTPSSHPKAVDGYVLSQTEYGLDVGHAHDHLDLTDPCHIGTHSTQRVDGLGRTVYTISRHRPVDENGVNCQGDIIEKITRAEYGLGAVTTIQEENGVSIARKQLSDSLGRMRVNLDLNFGKWTYDYNDLGELIGTTSPTGDQSLYEYDPAGRLRRELYRGAHQTEFELEAEYFYDQYPGNTVLGLDQVSEWGTYPDDYPVEIGRLIAVKDRTGVTVSAANHGSFSESWRVVYPENRLYHTQTLTDHAGRLEYTTDPDGDQSTARYHADGTMRSTYWNDRQVIKRVKTNYLGQTERTEYGDDDLQVGAQIVTWTGYDPVTHQPMSTVVHQKDAPHVQTGASGATLMAFGYAYDVIGKLEGVVDWRGRGPSANPSFAYEDTRVMHPSLHIGQSLGATYPNFPSGDMDANLPAPGSGAWNDGTEPNTPVDVTSTASGWPLGVSPSDAWLYYDTQYQLVGEERTYINDLTGDETGFDYPRLPDGSLGPSRVKELSWQFDQRGSMTSWEEHGANIPDPDSPGRALGQNIVNGFQLNQAGGCSMDWLAENHNLPPPGTCYIPDALYFSTNVDPNNPDIGPGHGRGTCVWVEYDAAGRMKRQHVRTGCTSCNFEEKPWDPNIYFATNSEDDDDNSYCPGVDYEEGTPGELNYRPRVDASYVSYEYFWNSRGQLEGATRFLGSPQTGTPEITMAYIYDASGARVIREKSDVLSGQLDNIRQDLYLGGYERRQVSLIDQDNSNNEVSINQALPNIWNNTADLGRYRFDEIDGTRNVKYAGLRIQAKYNDTTGTFDPPQLFLSFNNHLGSTSAVIDYNNENLVEWRTHYAYGADESGWKNGDEQYDNTEEPYGFTGKEEDQAVGLHYFGARYYSSYLGRWLSPDPPVVHEGGVLNYFQYGANSPYIAIDPDGKWIHIVIGAAVGAVTGFVSGLASGKGIKGALVGAAIGAAVGAVVAATAGAASGLAAGGWAGAAAVTAGANLSAVAAAAGTSAIAAGLVGSVAAGAVAAGIGYAQARIAGASVKQALLSAGISFGSSVIGAGLGAGFSQMGRAVSAIAGYAVSVGLAYGAAAATGTLTEDNWDEILLTTSISYAASYAGGAIGEEVKAIKAGGVDAEGTEGGDLNTPTSGGEAQQGVHGTWDAVDPKDLPHGPVELHWDGQTKKFDSMQGALNYMDRLSTDGTSQTRYVMEDGLFGPTPVGKEFKNFREVGAIFYRKPTDPSTGQSGRTIHGDLFFGGTEGGSVHLPSTTDDYLGNSNITIIGEAHTHPLKHGDYFVDNGAAVQTVNPHNPSIGDMRHDLRIDAFAGRNIRSFMVHGSNQFVEFQGY